MKKNFLFLTVLITLVTVFISSCTNYDDYAQQENNQEVEDKQEMKQLILALEKYNASYQECSMETRGLGKWFTRFYRVTFCDAVGALCGALYGPAGAVAGGVSSSVCAYCLDVANESNCRRASTVGEVNMSALTDVVFKSNIPMCTDSVGFFHNKIIMNLETKGMLYMDENDENLFNEICAQAVKLTLSENSATINNAFLKEINFYRFMSEYPQMSSLETFDDFVKANINLYPEYEDELNILHDFIDTLCGLSKTKQESAFIMGTLNIIGNSQVSNVVKKRLGEAIITGYASSKLWIIE